MKFSFIHLLIRFRVDNATVSGDSRIKKVGGLCGAKEKVGSKHKCLS